MTIKIQQHPNYKKTNQNKLSVNSKDTEPKGNPKTNSIPQMIHLLIHCCLKYPYIPIHPYQPKNCHRRTFLTP